ncbi:MAG: SIMPL domain-containing protein [bacterium]|nr:SIMPL domain-containing protein [bacterium]
MFFYQDFSNKNKKYLRIMVTLFMAGLMLSSFAFAFYYFSVGLGEWRFKSSPRQITVTGEGKVSVKPDLALVNLGVVNEGKKIKDVQNDNAKSMNAIISWLKEKGVAEKDTKTIQYSIEPQYQYFDSKPCYDSTCSPRRPPEIISYQIRNTLEVKIRALDGVDDILGGAVAKGANEVSGLRFTVEDEEKVKAQAREEAIKKAKEKAESIADGLGAGLGRVISFSESGGFYPVFAKSAEIYGLGGAAPATPQVQAGEQEIVSNVVINYELK